MKDHETHTHAAVVLSIEVVVISDVREFPAASQREDGARAERLAHARDAAARRVGVGSVRPRSKLSRLLQGWPRWQARLEGAGIPARRIHDPLAEGSELRVVEAVDAVVAPARLADAE